MNWFKIAILVVQNIPTIIKLMKLLPDLAGAIHDLIEKFSTKKKDLTGEPYSSEKKAEMFDTVLVRKVEKRAGVVLPQSIVDQIREKTWAQKNPNKKAKGVIFTRGQGKIEYDMPDISKEE